MILPTIEIILLFDTQVLSLPNTLFKRHFYLSYLVIYEDVWNSLAIIGGFDLILREGFDV